MLIIFQQFFFFSLPSILFNLSVIRSRNHDFGRNVSPFPLSMVKSLSRTRYRCPRVSTTALWERILQGFYADIPACPPTVQRSIHCTRLVACTRSIDFYMLRPHATTCRIAYGIYPILEIIINKRLLWNCYYWNQSNLVNYYYLLLLLFITVILLLLSTISSTLNIYMYIIISYCILYYIILSIISIISSYLVQIFLNFDLIFKRFHWLKTKVQKIRFFIYNRHSLNISFVYLFYIYIYFHFSLL